jgi:hypothetical protein
MSAYKPFIMNSFHGVSSGKPRPCSLKLKFGKASLYREDHLTLLQDTPTKWITRVPGTLNEVKAALAQADPEPMVPWKAGYRGQTLTSTYGGVAQRWLLIASQPRRPQARRTVHKRWLKPLYRTKIRKADTADIYELLVP